MSVLSFRMLGIVVSLHFHRNGNPASGDQGLGELHLVSAAVTGELANVA
jgi:hypothetical protein